MLVKVGYGEEDSTESSRCTELHTGNDNRDHNQSYYFSISSSVDEDNSRFSEDENSSLGSVESIKVQLKKHALTTKENHSQNVYEYEDVSSSSVEEVALEESKAITFTQGKLSMDLGARCIEHMAWCTWATWCTGCSSTMHFLH